MFQLQLCRHLCINNVISNFYRRVGGGKPEKRWGEMHFNCYANPQGWLPPCNLSVVVAGSAIHGHTQNRRFNRKAPATPQTTRAGESDQDGHPGKVKPKRGGRRAEEWMGACVI